MKLTHALWGFFIFTIFATFALPNTYAAGLSASEIVSSINKERTSRGLNALNINPKLTQAAQNRSAVLARAGRIFHVSARKDTPWAELSQVGYTYTLAGENLALGIEAPSELASRWMASPTHRENILEAKFEDIGIGITTGYYEGQLMSYVVSYYGQKKAGATSASISQVAPVISSTSVKPISKPVPVEALVRKAETSPVLSDRYTLETLPPAIPDISASLHRGEKNRVRIVDRIIALLGSFLKSMRMGEA